MPYFFHFRAKKTLWVAPLTSPAIGKKASRAKLNSYLRPQPVPHGGPGSEQTWLLLRAKEAWMFVCQNDEVLLLMPMRQKVF